MAKNDVELKGNLTRDPHCDYLDGRDGPVPFMRFTLAVDRHPPRQQGTDYLQVVSYEQNALHDHAYLRQGSEVFVAVRLSPSASLDPAALNFCSMSTQHAFPISISATGGVFTLTFMLSEACEHGESSLSSTVTMTR